MAEVLLRVTGRVATQADAGSVISRWMMHSLILYVAVVLMTRIWALLNCDLEQLLRRG